MKAAYFKLLEEIKNSFKRSHRSKAVLGLSGGLDSALSLQLCCDALHSRNVHAIIMPERGLTRQRNIEDAIAWAKKFRVRHFVMDINPILDAFGVLPWKQSKIALMNTKARIRALLLYNYANSNNALVIGTANKSELLLGHGTKYGDLSADVFILGGLLRTEAVELARYLRVTESIIRKQPSAELTVGQTDEADLGASYAKLDVILRNFLKGAKLNRKDHLVKKTLLRIERNRHKLDPVPILEVK